MSQTRHLPIYVTDCARLIKAAGGAIWRLEKPEYGFVLRCEHGPQKFRIILPPVGNDSPPLIPPEKGLSHVVADMAGLKDWLEKFIKKG